MIMKKYSREDEAKLPSFSNHEEARSFFKEKHGDLFQMTDSQVINGMKYYFYNLVLDKRAYNQGNVSDSEFLDSHQRIEIREDGFVHIIH